MTLRRVRPFPFDRLDRVARAQIEAARVLLSHLPPPLAEQPEIEALLGGPIAIRLADAYAFPVRELLHRLPGPPAPALVRVSTGGDRAALLAIDPLLASRLARRILGEQDARAGAAPLGLSGQAALAALLSPLCAAAGARLEGFIAESGEIAPLFPDPLVLGLDARVATPAGDGWVRLLAPERLRLRAPRRLATGDLLAHRARLQGAPVELAVEIGRAVLRGPELCGIEPGDVVVCDRFGPRPPLGGPVTLRLGRGRLLGHLDGEGITVVKGFEAGSERMELDAMEHEDKGAAGPEDEALLRELPVEVVCELGRVTMSGRELLELRPGAVLPVGRPLAGPIDLTVGGRLVARGELVDVEGEVGVRLTQVMD